MPSNLETLFRESAPRPKGPPPVNRIRRRARWLWWRDQALRAGALLAIVAVAVPLFRFAASVPRTASGDSPDLQVVARIAVDNHPLSVAFGEGSAWVVTWEGTLQRLDPATNEVVATIPILDEEQDGGVLIDDQGKAVGPAPAEPGRRFGTVTVGEGAVWVTEGSAQTCTVYKVDPGLNEVVGSVEMDGCYPVLPASGSLWVGVGSDGDRREDYLARLDTETLRVEGQVPIGPCCMSGITFGDGSVWVGVQDVGAIPIAGEGPDGPFPMELKVLSIDPLTNEVESVALPGDSYRPGDTVLGVTMSASGHSVWLTRPEAGFLDRIDTARGVLTDSIPLEELRLPDGPMTLGRYVAVTALNRSQIALVDSAERQIVDGLDTGAALGIPAASGDGALWLAQPGADTVIRLEVAPGPSASNAVAMSARLLEPGTEVGAEPVRGSNYVWIGVDVRWDAANPPGVHRCTWKVLDDSGATVAVRTNLFLPHVPMSRGEESYHLKMLDLTGEPASVSAGCDPERLDTPGITALEPPPEPSDWDATLAQLDARVERWADRFGIQELSTDRLAGNMWALRNAIVLTPEGDGEWLQFRELSMRLHALCVLLPADHEFRGGEFCD
jgi:DNA-binding beta-propeller fold protein YncE